MSLSTDRVFDVALPWRVGPHVSLRDESFGALAYNHDNRRLVFLKSTALVTLVRHLDEYENAFTALDVLVPAAQRDRYRRALESLVASGIICGR